MKIKTEYYLADVDKEKIIKKRKALCFFEEEKYYTRGNNEL